MEIKSNLFDLTDEQIKTSEIMYNGKVIKCLVAPYHNFSQLENVVTFTKTTYLLPEREASAGQLAQLISMVVNLPTNDEIRIITASQSIILDMVDTSVRILTESGDVVPCPCKTFMANIHDIKYHIMENDAYRVSKKEKDISKDKVNEIISFYGKVRTAVSEGKSTVKLKKEYVIKKDIYRGIVDSIGEDIIRNILKNHIRFLDENLI